MKSCHGNPLLTWPVAAVSLLVLVFPTLAQAHAFGQRYELPLPLELYLLGAAGTVILSFVVMALFVRQPSAVGQSPRLNLFHWSLFRGLSHPFCLNTLRLVSVGLLLLVLLSGFYGFPVIKYNFAPTFVWVIWWVGFAYLSALVGDLWALLNPWKIVFSWLDAALGWIRPGSRLGFNLHYPPWLGVFPGLLLFLAFAWLEHAYPDNAEPEVVAGAALGYSLITWSGMLIFGRDAWLRGGELFSILFGLFARFAPTEFRVVDSGTAKTADREAAAVAADRSVIQLNLRPWASGLVGQPPLSVSMLLLVIMLLSVLALDGFLETPLAAELFQRWQAAGGESIGFVSLALLIAPLLFLSVYLGFCGLIKRTLSGHAEGRLFSSWDLAQMFAMSLLPIAIGYHLAHYLSFLLVQGQGIIALISDPFGLDWDLFGTAYYRIDIAIAGARFAWYSALISIVIGHLIGVYLAHTVAVRAFNNRRLAIRSQYPMLLLMVAYTLLSLWILAQPVIGF